MIYCGQVHSPHFKNFIVALSKERVHRYFTICTYPYFNNDIHHCIFDYSYSIIFNNKISIEEFNIKIFNFANNPLTGISRYVNILVYFLRPNLFWIHELQSGAYSLDFNLIKHNKLIVGATVYGNDIIYFKDHREHFKKINYILSNLDFIHVESKKEIDYLCSLNLDIKKIQASATLYALNEGAFLGGEKKIDLLFRGGYGYRASCSNIIDMLCKYNGLFNKYSISAFECDEIDRYRIDLLNSKYDLKIKIFNRLSHSELQILLIDSKFLLFNSYSDGYSNLCREAWQSNCIVITSSLNLFTEFYSRDMIKYFVDVINDHNRIISNIALYDSPFFKDFIKLMQHKLKIYYSRNKSTELSLNTIEQIF